MSSNNESILEISAITNLCAEIGVRLASAIFSNQERARLEMENQEEEISTKYDFFNDDNDNKMNFPDDISVKIEEDFLYDDNDVVIKQ